MFDPNLPQENTPADAVQMRSQLNGLKAIIDAILTLTAAQVDGVNTVEPGNPANATVSVTGNTLHFTFDIPRGNDGIQGQPGTNGNDGGQGPPGNDGAQGPPFAQAIVDGVTTLDPGQQATVGVSFDGSNVRFQFAIPRGNDGSNGSDGAQGQPGEVSQSQLDSAISGTSANTNNVSTLDTGFADPDMEALRQKVNEMILNGRR
jgi:hypothetical protein